MRNRCLIRTRQLLATTASRPQGRGVVIAGCIVLATAIAIGGCVRLPASVRSELDAAPAAENNYRRAENAHDDG